MRDPLALDGGAGPTKKLGIYARERVPHVWLTDPIARTVEVLQLQSGRWSILSTDVGCEVVRAEPFAEIEIDLGVLWPEE